MRSLTLAAGLSVAVLAVAVICVDEGEVLTLTTIGADDVAFETELWVVDLGGETFVRAATPNVEWLDRVRAHPDVNVLRNGVPEARRAFPVGDPETRETVARAMREKYGLYDRIFLLAIDDSRSVPVRLDPPGSSPE